MHALFDLCLIDQARTVSIATVKTQACKGTFKNIAQGMMFKTMQQSEQQPCKHEAKLQNSQDYQQ